MRRIAAALGAALLLCACQHHPSSAAAVTPAFSPGIVAPDLAAHLRTLAADRNANESDDPRVLDYVVEQFKRMGLEPGLASGWLQDVPYLESSVRDATRVELAVAGAHGTQQFTYGQDLLVGSPAALPHAELKDSPIVFVGYGVDAPDEQWNDYEHVDVRGKTVIVLSNDPGWGGQDPKLFKGRRFTHYGLWAYKLEEAARQGAAAAFIVHDDAATHTPWSAIQAAWKRPQRSLNPAPGETRLGIGGWLSHDAARRLLADAGADLDALEHEATQRGFRARPLDARLSIALDSDVVARHTANVVGRITGTRQPNEAIVYTAHWDELRHDSGPIRRAIDSGTGLAGLLEIAEAFVHSAPRPHRSLLFVATAMGESGMLGSRYYVDHPPVSLDQTVAAINLDTLPIAGPDRTIALIGYGQSQLDDYLEAAARLQHRRVTPEAAPERGFFFRSDQLNFANAGVPVLYASSASQPAGRTGAQESQPFDMRGAIEDLRMLYMVGEKLTAETSYPQWKPEADFKRPAVVK